MRVIGNIPHPSISITIFAMNDKYQIRFEAGPMEQILKLSQTEIDGIEGIKKMVDDEFISKINNQFNTMYLSFKEAKAKIKKA